MEITEISSFLGYWERFHERTRRLVTLIPPERIEWSWREGRFTLGDQVRHLALIERWMFAENAWGRPSAYRGCGREHADGHAAVLQLFDELNGEVTALLAKLTPERLQERCRTPGGAELAVGKWLRAMVEHHAHHRGQIYLLLAMLDIPTPPIYGLTSEEVAARSTG